MSVIARLLPALIFALAMVPRADAAVVYFLDANTVTATGGSFTVSASGDPGKNYSLLGIDLDFFSFSGPLAGNDLHITGVVSNDPGLAPDPEGSDDFSEPISQGDNFFYFFKPTGAEYTYASTKSPLATFSFEGPGGLFLPGSSFTVSLDPVLSIPNEDEILPGSLVITAVPEPATVVALTCLAAGAGFRRRWSQRKAARATTAG